MLTLNLVRGLLGPARLCKKCENEKSAHEFNVRSSWCRECSSIYGKAHYAKNIEGNREQHRRATKAWRVQNPEEAKSQRRLEYDARMASRPAVMLFEKAKVRAKKKGRPFTIEEKDIAIPEHCPVLGIPLSAVGSGLDSAPSLDRIDSAGGYVPGNVIVISKRANTSKSYGSAEEHERIAAWMRSQEPKM